METATVDAFNWPMPGRDSLMSLSGINYAQDKIRSQVANRVFTKRTESQSLFTNDIKGANPKIFIP